MLEKRASSVKEIKVKKKNIPGLETTRLKLCPSAAEELTHRGPHLSQALEKRASSVKEIKVKEKNIPGVVSNSASAAPAAADAADATRALQGHRHRRDHQHRHLRWGSEG